MGSKRGKRRNEWAVLVILATQLGCTSVVPNGQPLGKIFPSIEGTSLSGETRRFPETESERPTILLIGYTQFSQFDLDRWILGLTQLEVPAQVVEIPTIPGIVPGLFANQIDSGMRRGIPETDWKNVVTVYSDGEQLVAFLGNEKRIMVVSCCWTKQELSGGFGTRATPPPRSSTSRKPLKLYLPLQQFPPLPRGTRTRNLKE